MKIFQFSDYRHFIRFRINELELNGRGELATLATVTGVKRPYLSQVLSGTKNLSHEQAFSISQHFKLDPLEIRFFYLLIDLSRAQSPEFKKSIAAEMEQIKKAASIKLGEPSEEQPLDEQNQVIFYSSWSYSAVQLLTGLPGGMTPEQITKRLFLDLNSVKAILAFLVSNGLCTSNGIKYFSGKRSTPI